MTGTMTSSVSSDPSPAAPAESLHLHNSNVISGDNILQGNFSGTARSGMAVVLTDSELKVVRVNGIASVNGAIHGDEVELRMKNKREDDDGDEGVVVRVLQRRCTTLCGKAEIRKGRVVVCPVDQRLPEVTLVNLLSSDDIANHWLIIAIDGWNDGAKHFEGHVVEKLDFLGSWSAESRTIMFGLPRTSFPPFVLVEMSDIPQELTPLMLTNRRDLTSLPICSVDPPGCKDIDDTVYCVLLPNGNVEVGVSIADVSGYVHPGSEVDIEASKRGTSVYLADTVINMIPTTLSEELCSLQAGKLRPAFTALSEITRDGDVLGTEFVKSLIVSKAAFTYQQAQELLDSDATSDDDAMAPVATSLKLLQEIAGRLRQKRIQRGALLLGSTEIAFTLDASSQPVKISVKPVFQTNTLVEEVMVVANQAAAQFLMKEHRTSTLVKIHPAPRTDAFKAIGELCLRAGIELDVTSNQRLTECLDALNDQPVVRAAISSSIARCLPKAFYGCTGYRGDDELSHFGLGLSSHATFTSPIRRYADVIVHRMLSAAIGHEDCDPKLFDKKAIELISQTLNERERDAKRAERGSKMLFTQLFARTHNVRDEAIIVSVAEHGFDVLTKKYHLSGKVNLVEKQQVKSGQGKQAAVKFVFNKKDLTLTASGVSLSLWQFVVVDVDSVTLDPRNSSLKFRLLEPRITGFNDLKRRPAAEDDDAESVAEDDDAESAARPSTSQSPDQQR